MEIQETPRADGITQLALIGKLDIVGLHAVDIKFHGYTAARRRHAIVDLSRLEFIASLGIGMIYSCSKSMERHKVRMVLVNPPATIDEVLRLTGIDQAMPIVKTMKEAESILAGETFEAQA